MSNELRTGDIVRLAAVSRKGANRLREIGTDLWQVQQRWEHVACFDGHAGLQITPVTDVNGATTDALRDKRRWLRLHEDRHFEIVEIVRPATPCARPVGALPRYWHEAMKADHGTCKVGRSDDRCNDGRNQVGFS